METQIQIGKGISYYHDRTDDKHYFGGFLNLAQNNINQVLKEFKLRLNIVDNAKNDKDILNNFFSNNRSFTEWERGISILKEYFPVIEYIDLPTTDIRFDRLKQADKENAKRDYFRKTLLKLLSTVESLRNFYTHYYHAPITIEPEVFDFLDSALLKVCLDMKRNKMKTDNTKEILNQTIGLELEKLKKLKIEELKKKIAEGKRANINDKVAIQNAIYNDAFAHLIYVDSQKKDALKDVHKSKLPIEKIEENGISISRSGLMFILSMFLSKKEIEQCKSNIEGFKGKVFGEADVVTKNENSLKFMATQWVFSLLAFKGLKHRVKNTFDKETLLVQIVDELSKVPNEIYQVLSEKDKLEFLEDINEFVQIQEGDDDSLEKSIVVHPVIRKRYESKFNYFAIRYLDEFANFPTLRFQIFAGNYLHDNRPKTIQGVNFITDRQIKEKINVFGKLSDVAKYKSDFFEAEVVDSKWELFPNPSYNFAGGNMPVFIDLKKSGPEAIKLHAEISQIKKQNRADNNEKEGRGLRTTKAEMINQIYAKSAIHYAEPTAILSLNELPALLYELLINKKSGAELEKIIVEKLIERFETIKNFDKSQPLTDSQITKKLKKSDSNTSYDFEKLKRAILKEIDVSNEKIKMIEVNRKMTITKDATGKKFLRKFVFFTNELGQEATWLTNDLIRFMPESARKNWKGHHHSELQRLLAFYDRCKNEAKSLLSSVWNMQSEPFWGSGISEAFIKNQFDAFYEAYNKKRIELLEGFIVGISDNMENPKVLKKWLKDIFIVFDKRFYTIQSTEKQKKELLSKPLVFPRGIFEDKPTFIEGASIQTTPELFADWFCYCHQRMDNCQKFYKLNRAYKERMVEKTKNDFPKPQTNFTDKEILKFKRKQDNAIKETLIQDIMLKCMVDEMFKKIFKQDLTIDLSEIYQTKEERAENQRIADEQKKREKGNCDANIINENFIWNKTVSVSLFNGRIVESNVKIKDIGKFRKMENDDKVKNILEYDDSKVWNKLEIEDELENKVGSYERIRREQLLKEIHVFEKQILSNIGFDGVKHPEDLSKDNNPNFRYYIANGALNKTGSVDANEIEWLKRVDFANFDTEEIKTKSEIIKKAYFLILLRNKFSHNQLPAKEAFDLMLSIYKKEESESYSEYYLKVVNKAIESFR